MPLSWLPNTITLLRCALAFGVGGLILWDERTSWLPFVAFGLLAATDFIDGWLARRLKAISKFGAFLDPVADKLLVGVSLLAITHLQQWAFSLAIPTFAIVLRDLIATGLRLAPKVEMPVSRLAKWKTAIEMFGIAALLLAAPIAMSMIWPIGLVLVWGAAALSVYTLGLYLGALLANRKRPR
jgi:cardiolipin synthase